MKQLKADIVIAGGGAAGLAAAVQAVEMGTTVIVLEKAAHTGGAGNMGSIGGIFAAESRWQRERHMSITREDAFKAHMYYTHWKVDARLVKAYIDKSADTLEWMEKLGVEFMEPRAYYDGSYPTYHTVKGRLNNPGLDKVPPNPMKILADRVRSLGSQIFLKTPVMKVIKEGERVTGVEAEDDSGETIRVESKAVIIATGGFADNPEWIKKYTGYEFGRDFFSFRIPGMTGDGIRMAWEAGAAQSEMLMQITHDVPRDTAASGTGFMHFQHLSSAFRHPNLMVNLLGERFMNEEEMKNFTFMGNAIARQKDRCAFLIFDEDFKEAFNEETLKVANGTFRRSKFKNIDDELKQASDLESYNIFIADSLEELCDKTGIRQEGLRKTLSDYNRACEKGYDDLFHKNHRFLRPVRKSRFFINKHYPGAYGSLGGIKINYKTEVITKEFEPIPGLYAAGDDANSIYGDSYSFVLPGNTMGFALNSGRIAAENAIEYIKSKK